MSLADELLADFSPSPSPSQSRSGSPEINDEEDKGHVQVDENVPKGQVLFELESTARLLSHLTPLLEKIVYFQGQPSIAEGNIEDNPEYKLLVDANTLAVEIVTEIVNVHKYIKEKYYPRFPELESLILNPVDYSKAVEIIANDVKSVTLKSKALSEFLQAATVMVITVSSSTSSGRDLSATELGLVQESCHILLYLDSARHQITSYVAAKLSLFAPNVAALIGPETAAQLFSIAGGLTGLSKMPSCNIPSMGSKRDTLTIGLGHTGIRQQGFLYHSPLIQSVPMDLRKNALRILAGKVVLAARIDRVHQSVDGSEGRRLEQEVLEKLEKLGEPPTNKGAKALPVPDDKLSKKRGGRRARKYKERFAMTDLRKAQNRIRFGENEDNGESLDESIGYGRVRGPGISSASDARLSKGMQQRLKNLN
ncbi:hypothetical protein V1514DRAFT_370235 [Lipomyces japonicus]|uniref:uncharacterized protein n=1 Tax=Lipomyces japonicus TaxID=56871 RepID=UPI0034D004AC